MTRPSFIVSPDDVPETTHRYPDSTESMAPSRALGVAAGLVKIGLHLQRLPPGTRTSFPHAESAEEEFVYVLSGEVDVWVDGVLHRVRAGELVGFPSGTGISHTVLNDGPHEATLLVGGERTKPENRIVYPLNPERRPQLSPGEWWDDAPSAPLGTSRRQARRCARSLTSRVPRASRRECTQMGPMLPSARGRAHLQASARANKSRAMPRMVCVQL
jgi:uncharacterized cupin superfamily protein